MVRYGGFMVFYDDSCDFIWLNMDNEQILMDISWAIKPTCDWGASV